jgi:hypothetical protein
MDPGTAAADPAIARSAPILRRGAFTALLAAILASACGSTGPRSKGSGDDGEPTPPPVEAKAAAEFDLYVFGRVLGTIAPCGCTTEPLGGLQYAMGFIDTDSTPAARLVIEPGSFLFPDPKAAEWPTNAPTWAQAEQRATTLQSRFAALGDQLVSGLGPIDVMSPKGTASLGAHPLPRVVANLAAPADGLPAVPTHRLATLQDHGVELKVGVTAVVDPAAPEASKLGTLSDPIAALTTEVAAMRKAGAHVTIALLHGDRAFVESAAKQVEGLDVAVVGIVDTLDRARIGTPTARLGDTFIVEAGEQLQTMTHLRLVVAAGAPVPTSSAQWQVVQPKATRLEELARVEARLAKFEADASADPKFLESLRAERDELQRAVERLPDAAQLAEFDQVKVTCRLPVDDGAKATLAAYNDWVSSQNQKLFAGVRPPDPPAGEAHYVGDDECETCHEEAQAFWDTTVHAGAYQTLVDTNQQYDLSCVSCHVTGFRKPGGSEVVDNELLRDIQCETCHGPGSLHVEEPEKGGKPMSIRRDAESLVCGECHTPEHSDTFEYEAYMRDILGEGHGQARRASLGEGPTGAKLRAEGLAKAGGSCKKM